MSSPRILPLVSNKISIQLALERIQEERDGKQRGLITRFENINRAVSKYFRFGYVTMLAGRSGSGKSYIANFLIQDFLDFSLNGNFYDFENVRVLFFDLEMKSEDQVIRSLSTDIGVPYNLLLSSFWNYEEKRYVNLSDNNYELVKKFTKKLEDRNLNYVNESGTLDDLELTVETYVRLHPGVKLVLIIDHALLIDWGSGDETSMLRHLGSLCIKWSKKGHMVIVLNQLNKSIESSERILKKQVHTPDRGDVYGNSQLWNAMDNVFIAHAPENLGITQYTVENLITERLIHVGLVKNRFGNTGDLYFKNRFDLGRIEEKNKDYFSPPNT